MLKKRLNLYSDLQIVLELLLLNSSITLIPNYNRGGFLRDKPITTLSKNN